MADSQLRSNAFNGSPRCQGSSEFAQSKLVKGDRSRRSWSVREEAILLTALKNLVATGWKSDNGFRAGYLMRVEEALKREFPKTDLKANPLFHLKITTWKKNYYSLSNILDRSGVGFNADGDFKIDCDDDQWAQIVQKDNSARYMRNKLWHHWNAWKEIFGKDRAIGVRAGGAGEVVAKMKGAIDNTDCYVEGDDHMTFDELFPDEVMAEHVIPAMGDESNTNGERSAKKPVKKGGKKRKYDDQLDCILDMMNRMNEETNERLQALSGRIGYEFDQSAKREEVYKLLGLISGLTMKQKFYTCAKLVKEPELLNLFRSMPEEDRPEFVVFMLEIDGIM